jgi:KaiC/GvpD/RAD55 family RecA-like ATPase
MRKYIVIFSILLIICPLIFSSISNVAAQTDSDNDGISDSKEAQLASTYKPYLHFAGGEKFFPTDANYHIENSVLYLKTDDTNTLVESSPTMTSIAQYTQGDYFLNNALGGFEEIAEDYTQRRASFGDKIYAHVTSESGLKVIQYWFFYAFNPGTLNKHQGDWEMIQIVLDSTDKPQYAVYSQHHAGEKADWSDVEKVDNTHPNVYVALGSHASYFKPYQGKLGLESDILGNSYTLKPEDLEMVQLGEKGMGNHPSSQDWLEFGGKWGNWAIRVDAALGAAGPSGPGQGENAEKWLNPVSWGSKKFLANQIWFIASLLAYYFLYIFAAIIAVRAIYKIWQIVKRRREGNLNILKILRSREGIGVILGIVAILIYLVALFVPWYVVTGNFKTPLLETAGTTDLVLIDGINGIRVNTLQNEQGLATLFGIGIPFSIIFLSSVILGILDIIGLEKPRGLSWSYIMEGFTILIPVILILIFIFALAGLIPVFANFVGGGQTIPSQVTDIASALSSSPLGGVFSDTINSQGSLEATWGLAIGSYLFIAAAAIKIAGGLVITRTALKHADIKVKVNLSSNDGKVGENLSLKVEITNSGEEPAVITEMMDVIPKDFSIIEMPNTLRVEDDIINLNGKTLTPLKTEEVKVVLRPLAKGVFKFKPKIRYLDENGISKYHESKPVTLKVDEVVLPDRLPTGHKQLDTLLLGGIPEKYSVVLTAPEIDERETIIKSFLETGAKEGQHTFYITSETMGLEKLLKFESNFFLFFCNPKGGDKFKNLQNFYNLRSKTQLTNLDIALTKAFRTLDQSIEKPRRICIDTLSDILLYHKAESTRRWLDELIQKFRNNGFTILAVIDPTMHPQDQANAVLSIFDGQINLKKEEIATGNAKSLRITKLRKEDYIKNSIDI